MTRTDELRMKYRLLLVEDDPDIAELIRPHVAALGMELVAVEDGESGLAEALTGRYSLVVLDVTLPKMNGLDVCSAIRRQDSWLPILMLTSQAEVTNRVVGLELGADDYVTKPCSVPELVARIRALIRRSALPHPREESGAGSRIVRTDSLELDFEMRSFTRDGQPIKLTSLELQLLELLTSRPGKVFKREEIIEQLWGWYYPNIEPSLTRIVYRLRAKIEHDTAKPKHLKTVVGIGYSWKP
jgi:DNA-binding response OmpR family regulator